MRKFLDVISPEPSSLTTFYPLTSLVWAWAAEGKIKLRWFPRFSITSLTSSQTQRYILSYKMHHLPHLLLACVGLAASAPRKYGQDRQEGVRCRTEYTTVWETEYEERESHTCVTKWVPECKTVYEHEGGTCKPKTRKVVS